MNIPSPRCVKDVWKLTGGVTTLSRFISQSFEKCHVFFDALRKNKNFEWSDESENALQQLKQYLTNALLFSKPKEKTNTICYLVVTPRIVYIILVRKDGGKQRLVYYTCKALLDAKTMYSLLEKL